MANTPVTYASKDDAPFLTLHGRKDERVDFQHSERIHAALNAAGMASLLVPVVDGVHGINHPQMPARIRTFFD